MPEAVLHIGRMCYAKLHRLTLDDYASSAFPLTSSFARCFSPLLLSVVSSLYSLLSSSSPLPLDGDCDGEVNPAYGCHRRPISS